MALTPSLTSCQFLRTSLTLLPAASGMDKSLGASFLSPAEFGQMLSLQHRGASNMGTHILIQRNF